MVLAADELCLSGTAISTLVTGWVASRQRSCRVQKDENDLAYKAMFGLRFYLRLAEGVLVCDEWQSSTADEMAIGGGGDRYETRFGVPVQSYTHFALLAMRSAELHKGVMKLERYRSYAVLRDTEAVEKLYSQIPPGDRSLEEVLLTDTPHCFFMDIEHDLDAAEKASDVDHTNRMLLFLQTDFIPHASAFFRSIGVPCTDDNWAVTNSSKRASKFSVHMVLRTPGKHYFGSRVESWIAAAMLAAYLETVADTFEPFDHWYRSGGKCVVDYSVYARGARNMRLVGSSKPGGDGARVGSTHWLDVRPFLPLSHQRKRPWSDFVATVNEAPYTAGYSRIRMDIAKCVDVLRDFLADGAGWKAPFRSLMTVMGTGAAGMAQVGGPVGGPAEGGVGSGLPFAFGGGGEGTDDVPRDGALHEMRRLVTELAAQNAADAADSAAGVQFGFLREQNKRQCEQLIAVAKALVESMAFALHPGQRIKWIPPKASQGEICRARLPCFVTGATRRSTGADGPKRQRLCFWSFDDGDTACQGGSHEVEIAACIDFSTTYFCHRCKKHGIIVDSPLHANCIRPVRYDLGAPEGFEETYIDYEAQDDFLSASSPYMRDIMPIPGPFGERLFVLDRPRTVVLHGGMGTGKSTVIQGFLARLRAEVRADYNREPRILSITFRQMLAQSSAKSFGLQLYSDPDLPRCLADVDALACQLDSLFRIMREPEDTPAAADSEWATVNTPVSTHDYSVRPYDVVIIDEAESVISHINSKTMDMKRDLTFRLFAALVRRANTVIAGDADLGRRTRYFLRELRTVSTPAGGRVLPNLEFHRNRFLPTDILYVDHRFLHTWLESLVGALLERRKRVFLCSNSKAMLHRVREHVLGEVRRRAAAARGSGDADDFLDALERDNERLLLVLDADLDGAAKRMMAERCNEQWADAILLGITPVVGAGLSYDQHTYHEAFVYGCPTSCSPRGLLQLLGRVRNLIDARCHLFLDTREAVKTPAVTLDDAIKKTGRIVSGNLSELVGDIVAGDGNLLRFSRKAPDPMLAHITALNMLEVIAGKQDFRGALIFVMQNVNPAVNYRFDSSGSFTRDSATRKALAAFDAPLRKRKVDLVVAQKDMTGADTRAARRRDTKGARISDDPEEQHNAGVLLFRNELRATFGLAEGIAPEVMASYARYFGSSHEGIEQLRSAARLLFISTEDLYAAARAGRLLESINVIMHDDSGRVLANIRTSQRVAEEHDALEYRLRHWTLMLLYIGGFEGVGEAPRAPRNGEVPTGPITHPLVGHSYVMTQRVALPDVQAWLAAHAVAIAAHVNEDEPAAAAVTAEAAAGDAAAAVTAAGAGDGPETTTWTALRATLLIKLFFRKKFNIELSQSSPACENKPGLPVLRKRKKQAAQAGAAPAGAVSPVSPNDTVSHVCTQGHGTARSKCRELRMSDATSRIFFRLVHRYVTVNEENAEPAVRAICDLLDAPELPGLTQTPAELEAPGGEEEGGGYGPYCGYGSMTTLLAGGAVATAATVATEDDDRGDLALEEDSSALETLVNARDQRTDDRHRKRRVRVGEAEKEAAAWAETIRSYVPAGLYEAPLNRFVSTLLSPGLKVRTKRAMRFSVIAFRRKVDRVIAENNSN